MVPDMELDRPVEIPNEAGGDKPPVLVPVASLMQRCVTCNLVLPVIMYPEHMRICPNRFDFIRAHEIKVENRP